uniref:DUF223 domain-containing protein n=1 Tax=Brassica oleracea TaxID=3712 RepID=A0A3P6CSM1_BRAOL|nr:unnamed protein product [Brassica oleracea]
MSFCLSNSSNRRSRHPSLNLRVSPYSVIHGFIPSGRANHYMPSLKAGSIVKVDRFEVAKRSSILLDNFQVIANTNLELPDILSYCIWVYNIFHVVGEIRSVQGSDLSKETTRVVICLLIDP